MADNIPQSTLDFATILKASQALSSEIHLENLIITLLDTTIANAGASKGVLILQWDDTLQVASVIELGQEPKVLQTVLVDDSSDVPIRLIYTVKRTLQTVIIDEVTKEALLFTDSYIIQKPPQSLLCMPIINQRKLIGVLYLENQQTTGAFTKERVEILNLLCCQAAISLENARLYEQLKHYSHSLELKVLERTAELKKANEELHRIATLDGLTLVANRRQFDFYLQEQWQQFLLTNNSLGLLLCDIDYFKCYNDYYGHQAGDECLKQIAQLLNQVTKRPRDLVARYGGEEFAIILPDTDVLGAKKVAERIVLETNHLQIPHARSQVSSHITLSVGISSSLILQPNSSWYTLIATADRALYQAKHTGKNRYCVYE
ncbi:diguanylate cyclase domain-containing protein [Scytonema sp. NUACC26]|uniref:diguanylate cyclase domain-containing protein n=1 Tax=Scytonema sp. NUACC26 TaxID=3140176 RepID=UPI0034DC7AC5